jgi:hypothetical protein
MSTEEDAQLEEKMDSHLYHEKRKFDEDVDEEDSTNPPKKQKTSRSDSQPRYTRKKLEKLAKPVLVEEILKLEEQRKTGFWNYFQSQDTLVKLYKQLSHVEANRHSYTDLPGEVTALFRVNNVSIFRCPRCQNAVDFSKKDAAAIVPCGHSYCSECLKQHKKDSSKCSACSARIKREVYFE